MIDAALLAVIILLYLLLFKTRRRLRIAESTINSLSKRLVNVYNSQDAMKSRTQSLEQELELLKSRRRRSSSS